MRHTRPRIRRPLCQTFVLLGLLCSAALPQTPTGARRISAARPAAAPSDAHAASPSKAPTTPPDAREAYGRVALSFEANRGQTDPSVDFLARGQGYALFLKADEAVFALSRPQDKTTKAAEAAEASATRLGTPKGKRVAAEAARRAAPAVLRMRLVGADPSAEAVGAEELAGRVNYLTGNDPAKWRTDVPTYASVLYREVYPGIDIVYYGNQRQLEYDFRVAPGRDPRAVSLRFDGADRVEVGADGDLLLTLGESVVRQSRPVLYQEVAGARRAVEGGYVVGADGRVGFRVGEYDTRHTLVIDPVLVYSTYLGGSGFEDGSDIKVDPAGSAYVCGETNSTNFPTANAFQPTFGGATFEGGRDGFVTKLNAAGTAFVYSTYLGGNGDDSCNKIAVDSAGNAYLAGETTSSTNFPRANAFQNTFGGGLSDAFITKLNPAGNALVFSTYLGGDVFDAAGGIALDSSNNVYITGRTTSGNFPTANAIQATQAGIFADAFVTKLNAAGNALVYSTYLGGSDGTEGGFDAGFSIAVDSAGNAYVTGQTRSTNFPTLNPIQATFGGGFPDGDAFVTKLNPAGSALVYSTYLGGSENDIAFEIAVDSANSAHVAGVVRSTNFPTANALRSTLIGPSDAFLTKLNAAGTAFVYSTYFGGNGDDSANGVAIGADNNAYITGGTSSTDFPTLNPTQAVSGGGIDGFVTRLNTAGSALVYSTYLGGSGTDAGLSMALDAAGGMYIVGRTASTNFPVVTPVQSANGGGEQDAFVAKLVPDAPAASTFQFSQATYAVQEDVTFVNFTVTRTGDTSTAATVDYATADGTATERSDYTTALGTLRFAAGQTEASVPVLISEDSFTEGPQSFNVALSNPTGNASLGAVSTAAVQITDDAVEPTTNVIDDPAVFVGMHYHDFLNRQADAAGLAFWTNEIVSCGGDPACVSHKRENVSAAFFLSIEFQGSGYEVIRIYKASFTDSAARPRGLPRYREFLRDTQEVQRGVVVGQGNWEQLLNENRLNFARAWVQRADFLAEFPESMGAEQYINKLFANSQVTPTPAEFNIAFDAFNNGGVQGRAQALLAVVRSGSVFNRQYNPAFVLMQYIGYLRRNPNDAPNTDYAGYDFWLTKMNDFSLPGEDVRDPNVALARVRRAQMVQAFLVSGEYRDRFR